MSNPLETLKAQNVPGMVVQNGPDDFSNLPVSRTLSVSTIIPPGYSCVIAGGLTIAAGVTLTIGAGGVLALI